MTNKELLNKHFTNEEYELHRLVARKFILEDLKDLLETEFNKNIADLDEETINDIVERYQEYDENEDWYYNLRNAVRWIGIGEDEEEEQ